jgi:hypothetical protein
MLVTSSILRRVAASKSLLFSKKPTLRQDFFLNSRPATSNRFHRLIFIFSRNKMTENTNRFVVAIDQGTSSTRVILYDHSGRAVLSHQVPVPLITPKPGYAIKKTLLVAFWPRSSKTSFRLHLVYFPSTDQNLFKTIMEMTILVMTSSLLDAERFSFFTVGSNRIQNT